MAGDVLEAEALRRAVTGTVKFTGWYQGVPGGVVREYSDVLLIFLLKAALPDRYAERMQLGGQLANLDLSKLPDELIQRIANGEPVLGVLASASRDIGQTPGDLQALPVAGGKR